MKSENKSTSSIDTAREWLDLWASFHTVKPVNIMLLHHYACLPIGPIGIWLGRRLAITHVRSELLGEGRVVVIVAVLFNWPLLNCRRSPQSVGDVTEY